MLGSREEGALVVQFFEEPCSGEGDSTGLREGLYIDFDEYGCLGG